MLDLDDKVKEEAGIDVPYTEENIVFRSKDSWFMIYVCSRHPKSAICRYFLRFPGWNVKPDEIHIGRQVHYGCHLCLWGY